MYQFKYTSLVKHAISVRGGINIELAKLCSIINILNYSPTFDLITLEGNFVLQSQFNRVAIDSVKYMIDSTEFLPDVEAFNILRDIPCYAERTVITCESPSFNSD
ncbi:hypothetical protein LEM8419_00389 [Neolewinella maritima]|uniref:Uncharacterized protein n=1 Tax=Neolewinella maritima TaxID=1383882 RepID=A0ABM9AXC3_9BACT|nr:hypothetical protein LEM8419_00389 [Neolewinella maritima]